MAKRKSAKKAAKKAAKKSTRNRRKYGRKRAMSAAAMESQRNLFAHAAELTKMDENVFWKHMDKQDEESRALLKKAEQREFDPTKLTTDEAGALEAIILLVGRPVLFVENDEVEPVSDELWRKRLFDSEESIIRNIPSVGRIEINVDSSIFIVGERTDRLIGTCFVVAPNLVLTNRHVARIFCNSDGSIRSGFDTRVDFVEENLRDPDQEFHIVRAVEIGDDFDYALLEVDGGAGFPPALELADSPAGFEFNDDPLVYLIGYPAFDDRNPTDEQNRIFQGVFDVKRLAPGRLRKLENSSQGAERMQGDYTSLGGNSGSPVFDLESGTVVGLHYAGSYGGANFSVPIWRIADRIRAAASGAIERTACSAAPAFPTAAAATASTDSAEVLRLLHRVLDHLDRVTGSPPPRVERGFTEGPQVLSPSSVSLIQLIRERTGATVDESTALPGIFTSRASLASFLVNHVNARFRPRPPIHQDELWPSGTVGDLANLIESRT